MNHLDAGRLWTRIAQLRGELRHERASTDRLTQLSLRMVRLLTTVSDELHPDRIPELDVLLAHAREVLEAELERSGL